MPDSKQIQFMERMRRIVERHRKLERGFEPELLPDGLIVARPKRPSHHLVLRSFFACLIVLLGFKIFLLARLGPENYQQRLQLMNERSTLHRIGAYVMYPDGFTMFMARLISGTASEGKGPDSTG